MNRSKLLAAVAVMAMVFAAVAVVSYADESYAAVTDVATFDALNTALNGESPISVKLTADITGDLLIPKGKDVTIDLNGKKITNSTSHTIFVESTAKLIIDDSSTATGTIDCVTHAKAALAIVNGGEVIINDGNLTRSSESASNSWYVVKNEGALTINGGKITHPYVGQSGWTNSSSVANGWSLDGSNSLVVHTDDQKATLTITDGTITGGGYVKNDTYAETTISGGSISGTNAAVYSNSKLTITGGTFACETADKSAIYLDKDGAETTAKITGGAFTINSPETNERGAIYIIGDGTTVDISLKTISAPIVLESNCILNGMIDFDGNAAQFTGFKAGASDVKISIGSIVIGGDIADDNNGNIVIKSGTAKIDASEIPEGTTITVSSGAELEIPTGAEVTNNGTIINNGTIKNNGTINNTSGKITNNGEFAVGPSGNTPENITGNEPTKRIGIDSTLIGIEGDLIIDGDAFLAGNLTIPADKSLIIRSSGSLDLNGKTLTVEGKLVIETGASVIGIGGNEELIILTEKGLIENDGVIGYGDVAIKVGVYTDGKSGVMTSVVMKNVEGMSFGVEKIVDTTATPVKSNYYLTINGDVIATSGNVDVYSVTIDGAKVVGDLTIDSLVTATATNAVVTKNSTLTIAGTFSGSTITMENGSTVIITGDATGSTITAETGEFKTADKYDKESDGKTSVTLNNITGIELTVVSETYVKKDVNNKDVSMTRQNLVIGGTPAFVGSNTTGTIIIDNSVDEMDAGSSQIAEGTVFALSKGMKMTGDGIVINGEIQFPKDATTGVDGYIGTYYEMTDATNKTLVTCYITNFANALSKIDTVDKKTLSVYGPVEVKEGFTLAEGQRIDIKSGTFTIESDAKVVLSKGSSVTGTVTEVEGILIVEKGAKSTTPTKFAVKGTNTATGDVTYAGVAAAIANSNAGDVITIVGQGYDNGVDIKDALAVPADRTIVNQTTMNFSKDLVIDEGAKFTNQGTINMVGDKAKITVNGVLENYTGNAAIEFTNENGNIYANGSLIVATETDLTIGNCTVNGAYYSDSNGYVTVTTFAKAVAAVASIEGSQEVKINGKISESGDVTVNGDVVKTNANSVVSLGNITLEGAEIQIGDDTEFSATIIGAYGEDGKTSDASIVLSKANNMTVENGSTVDGMNVTIWSNTISAVNGNVTIASGEFVLTDAGEVTADSNSVLKVASGATLVLDADSELTLNDGEFLAVEGTLIIKSEATISSEVTIVGTLDIRNVLTVDADGTLTVTGDVVVSEDEDNEGTLTVEGRLNVGATPKALGAATGSVDGTITLDGGYVVVYDGAGIESIVKADGTAADGTKFIINDISYATAYGSEYLDVLNTEILGLADVLDGQTIEWYNGTEKIENAGTVELGKYSEVTSTVEWANVTIVISAGPGLQIYIDDLENNNVLSVGEHKVTVYIDPGYEGTPVITFNGQTITDGKIVITSDMAGKKIVLAATGATPIDYNGGSSDNDGMGLTDYLLIILVVMVVILAIVVILRMMRS